MISLAESGALIERFAVAKPDYVLHAERQAELFAKQDDYNAMGLKSGSLEGIIKNSAAASKDAQNSRDAKAERKSKQLNDDALFMALLENGDLDNFVAENVFAGMSDAEVTEVVAMIEAETGKSFEDYAKDILGNEMPERGDTENEVDYHRRVLTAVADEVLNDDLSFKAGYENDPVARVVRRNEIYQEALGVAKRINASTPAHAKPSDDVIKTVVEESSEGYSTSHALGRSLENKKLSGTSTNIQDGSTDATMEALPDNASGFGALSMASDALNTGFKTAAVQPVEGVGNAPEPSVDIKPVMPA